MQPSEVRPNIGSTVDPRVTGKNKNAKHMLPTRPNLRATLSIFSCHLSQISKSPPT